jgi:calcineurin-like phosphoesterase family protein
MAHEKFVISDTHFFHANILKFTRKDGTRIRPFSSLDEMHSTIIKNWNSVIQPNDYVYHLGDVTFRYDRPFSELMHQLNGRKRLILGNHDRIKGTNLMDFFEKVDLWKGFSEGNFTMSHMPLRLDGLRDGAYNVHGHTHQNHLHDVHYINVCVEPCNYSPVPFDTILEEIKEAEKS